MVIRVNSRGKRDIHNSEAEFDRRFQELKSAKWKHDDNREIVISYVTECLIGKAKSSGRNVRVSKGWLYRIIGQLELLSEEWLDKSFIELTDSDWTDFYTRLETDAILNQYGKYYSGSTKAKIYKTIRKFAKWKWGENKYYPKFCDEWVTKEPVVTKEYLTREEVDKLIDNTTTIRVRTLIAVLFDCGLRIEEACNIRWKDFKKTDKGYYQLHVRPETSKTNNERYVTVQLYADRFSDYLMAEKKRLGNQWTSNAYLFPGNYDSYYRSVKRVGKNILNKKISPHIFRHSSATYFADIIPTYQQFCTRYGWKLNSNVAERYYHRKHDDAIVEKTADHEIGKFKHDFEKIKAENESLKLAISNLKDSSEKQYALLKQIVMQNSDTTFKDFKENELLWRTLIEAGK